MSISIDGVHLRDDLGLDVTIDGTEDELLPEVQEYSVNVPGMHGEHAFKSWMQPRNFSVRVLIPPQDDAIATQHKARNLMAIFLTQYGHPKDVRLVFDFEPEKWYTVRIVSSASIQRLKKFGFAEFELKAYDPYAYAPATYYDPEFIPYYDQGYEYDTGYEYVNQTYTPFVNINQYAGVYNYSHYATPFSFVIDGYVENPKITNQTSGKSLQMNLTVQADEKLYVDSKLKTTWLVKASADEYFWLTPYQMAKFPSEWAKLNRYNDKVGDFLELVSGDNSLLFEGSNPNASVNFNWLHRFL